MRTRALLLGFASLLFCGLALAGDLNEQLWEAARQGDCKRIETLLTQGATLEARTHYGTTPLWLAVYKGQVGAVGTLLAHKADPNVMDRIWGLTPAALVLEVDQAQTRTQIMKLLLDHGVDPNAALMEVVASGNNDLVRTVLATGKVTPETLSAALVLSSTPETEVTKALKKAGGKPLLVRSDANTKWLSIYEGAYESHIGRKLTVGVRAGVLCAKTTSGDGYVLCRSPATGGPDATNRQSPARQAGPTVSVDSFQAVGLPYVHFVFDRDAAGLVVRATRIRGTIETPFERSSAIPAGDKVAATPDDDSGIVTMPRPWPSFRGPGARGVADGQHPPMTWDIDKSKNVRWKAAIPGLAHSSPIVWGNRVFLTTAVSSNPKTDYQPGFYPSGDSSPDSSKHAWRVCCLDASNGKTIWERTAREGVPRFKRHIKSSQNNQTPAADGKHVVAFFGSEGLFCYDFDGTLLWQEDIGPIDVGAVNDPELEWGAASSPIIYGDLVIVQCDRHKDSFIAAYDLNTGKRIWSSPRDELPSWSTPTVIHGMGRDELVTNAPRFSRGYDPRTGRELWRLGPHSTIAVPTPFAAEGLIIIADGNNPIQPIYAVLPGGSGDISSKDGTAGPYIAWSRKRGGPYMPTPIAYGPHLYSCSNTGMLACYELRTGQEVYKARLSGRDGYSASPVAADGRLYFTGEDGDIRVVKAAPQFQLLAVNKMKEPCMATPAISNGMIFVRTQHFLYGIGRKEQRHGLAISTASPGSR